jgi:hypothetical protein
MALTRSFSPREVNRHHNQSLVYFFQVTAKLKPLGFAGVGLRGFPNSVHQALMEGANELILAQGGWTSPTSTIDITHIINACPGCFDKPPLFKPLLCRLTFIMCSAPPTRGFDPGITRTCLRSALSRYRLRRESSVKFSRETLDPVIACRLENLSYCVMQDNITRGLPISNSSLQHRDIYRPLFTTRWRQAST